MVNGYVNVPERFNSDVEKALQNLVVDAYVHILGENDPGYEEYVRYLNAALSKLPIYAYNVLGSSGICIGTSTLNIEGGVLYCVDFILPAVKISIERKEIPKEVQILIREK